ncbi:MAG: segregation and condensation protein [Chloroflexota bacterium]|jgi:segregation and condensation protein A|nr:segregation and condensation protein [Chloroflexota bacterium]
MSEQETPSEAAPAGAPETAPVRFPVDVHGFRGPLEQLVATAQRGDVDLAAIPVSEITARFRARLEEADTDPRDLADFLSLASRLLSLKAARLLPDGAIGADEETADDGAPVDDPGARLAEYRLFRAAAEALLADASEQGARSFLSTVCPDVVPSERLAIAPQRLLSAFRAVLERLPEADLLEVPASSVSVEQKATELRAMLAGRGTLRFDEIFAAARSRLEAVAGFLALLELIKRGEARVDQEDSFGEITVTAVAVEAHG